MLAEENAKDANGNQEAGKRGVRGDAVMADAINLSGRFEEAAAKILEEIQHSLCMRMAGIGQWAAKRGVL